MWIQQNCEIFLKHGGEVTAEVQSTHYGKCSKNLYSKILISKRKIPNIPWGK